MSKFNVFTGNEVIINEAQSDRILSLPHTLNRILSFTKDCDGSTPLRIVDSGSHFKWVEYNVHEIRPLENRLKLVHYGDNSMIKRLADLRMINNTPMFNAWVGDTEFTNFDEKIIRKLESCMIMDGYIAFTAKPQE